MSDIFREVDEDLRRERAEKLWKQYGPALMGAAALIVAATAGYVGWERWQTRREAERTALLAQTVDKATEAAAGGGDLQNAVAALAGVADQLDGAHATLARLQQAGLLARQGDTAGAVALYDRIAGDGSNDPLFRELAQLLSVLHQIDGGDPAQLRARLQPLLAPTNPWRHSARELAGLLAAKAGDRAAAHGLFQQIVNDAEAPAGVRSRAADLAALYAEQK
ncbi:MAG TPA: tetratricopeptide repeat protein [Azospirillaceae bacterium]|nr:tetratricopeptide repeat protein [Azospirillaceae bacterium]